MAYTVTVRQAGVKRAEVGALLTHEYRKTLEHDGTTTQHDNENIDPTRSHLNRDYIFRNGELEPLIKVSDIHEELDRRLENAGGTRTLKDGTVKKIGLRSDAKVLRNFIVQLDPEHTGTVEQWEQKPEAERQKDLSLMVDTLIKDHIGGLYGKENLLSMTLHMDEKSPHIHLMVTPIDSEGRVRNESFIKNKSDMRKFWDGARTKLRAAGYEAEMVTRDVDAKHETLRQFKTRTGKAKAEALEVEEKARKQREELEKEAREAESRLRADLEEQARQAQLNLANDLKTAREELEQVKAERDKAKKSADVWISTEENIQENIGTLEDERDELQDENEALARENSRLKRENEQWSARNSNFLESWVKAQGILGRLYTTDA
ncbi:plasmid recombination protein, partial [Rothia nasimurium]|uniref:plasmid recombination protein n=1 Tax=Rothia nasimurium TaxID=85336 RepID=UPI001F0169C6